MALKLRKEDLLLIVNNHPLLEKDDIITHIVVEEERINIKGESFDKKSNQNSPIDLTITETEVNQLITPYHKAEIQYEGLKRKIT